MATKAYFLISLVEEFCQCQDGYQEVVKELEAIPEVKHIEPISGMCDLMVQVEAPMRVILVADKITPKKWLKNLAILRVEPPRFDWYSMVTTRELLHARHASASEAKTYLSRHS